ncbi:MAG TPA: HD domain-containing protein [Ktedonobacteraceae bacterium]|nr:HD domain-containing protein [Ktedonobacteraceae bacterium]
MPERPGKETLVTIDELLAYLRKREDFSQQELALLEDACAFAQHHYTHLIHPTGNPYLPYVCGVARILISLGADAPVVAAALLYPPPPVAATVADELRKQWQSSADLLSLIDELFHLDRLEWDIWTTQPDHCESHACKGRRKIIRKMHLLTIDEISGDAIESRADAAAEHFQKREKQIANLINMFFIAVSDFRPLMIKLADRLLLMRLLKDTDLALKEELQYVQLAKITLTVYAPIADRLGIWRLKSELEDMAFRLLNPGLYKEIGKRLEVSKQQREQAITQEIIPSIDNLLHEFGIEGFISGRAKHIYGVYQKMEARQLGWEQINDLLGIRILVETIEQCYEVQNIIHAFWEPRTDFYDGQVSRDWIANPKENMYQSLHTTIMMGERIVEVQIRTYGMHEIAEYGVTSATYAAHWRYKESKAYRKGKLPREIVSQKRGLMLVELNKTLKSLSQVPPHVHRDLLSLQKEHLKDRIFVITPKGHVLDFPAGATPLDFAYRIHSELGDNYSGAKVDDHIVRLDYKLKNGQIVELITSRMGKGPSPDWLTINKDEEGHSTYVFVRTRQARQKILSGLNKMRSEFNNKK